MLTLICTAHIGLNLGGSTYVVFVSAKGSIALAALQQVSIYPRALGIWKDNFMSTPQLSIVTRDYQGHSISYQEDGWFNATQAAAEFGKRVDHWIENKETTEYINALCEITNTRKSGYLKTKRGANGGTWLHPKLAVSFARWLDPKFAVWCDAQIDNLIHNKDDWLNKRHAIASSSKVMSGVLDSVRQQLGKATVAHHHMCEHKLINSLLTGEHKGLDREKLSAYQLEFLAHFEIRNAILIGMSLTYEQRKGALIVETDAWKKANAARIQAANDFAKLAA